MNLTADQAKLLYKLNQFHPENYARERGLALFSAVITFDDDGLTEKAIERLYRLGLNRAQFYEIILQSYLFLGFPRMLQAAFVLQKVLPNEKQQKYEIEKISEFEAQDWYLKGIKLCRNVYQRHYEPLKDKVIDMAPEIFRWMIHEGYGKVLSRNELDIVSRELSIIAFLMMENRSRQLRSHIQGALNVGTDPKIIRLVIDDIGDAAGEGLDSALDIMKKLGILL